MKHVECTEAVAKKAATDAQTAAAVSPDTPNVLQTMMQIEQTKTRAKATTRVASMQGIMSCFSFLHARG